jgi:hypothetical protein
MISDEGFQDVGDDLSLCVPLAVQDFEQPVVTGFRLESCIREVLEVRSGKRVGEEPGPGSAENALDIAPWFVLGLLAEREDLSLNCPVVRRCQSIPPKVPLAATPRRLTFRFGPEGDPCPPRDLFRRPEAHPASSPGHNRLRAPPRLNFCK